MNRTMTVTKAQLASMVSDLRAVGNNNGYISMLNIYNTLLNVGAVKANITVTYTGTESLRYIDKATTNWMELSDGTRLM